MQQAIRCMQHMQMDGNSIGDSTRLLISPDLPQSRVVATNFNESVEDLDDKVSKVFGRSSGHFDKNIPSIDLSFLKAGVRTQEMQMGAQQSSTCGSWCWS